jgi:hypothetical protein
MTMILPSAAVAQARDAQVEHLVVLHPAQRRMRAQRRGRGLNGEDLGQGITIAEGTGSDLPLPVGRQEWVSQVAAVVVETDHGHRVVGHHLSPLWNRVDLKGWDWLPH